MNCVFKMMGLFIQTGPIALQYFKVRQLTTLNMINFALNLVNSVL